MAILKFICHSHKVTSIALDYGWLPGARYTNLRDVKKYDKLYFLDIDWKKYNYRKHLEVAKETHPMITVARDIMELGDLTQILKEASELSLYAEKVIIVPKDEKLAPYLPDIIPDNFLLGFSVPTNYGGTSLKMECFSSRKVHLLGGHPAKQRILGNFLNIFSLDCNRITLDAKYGDYFDGVTFRPHNLGGYDLCLKDSLSNVNKIWEDYKTQ